MASSHQHGHRTRLALRMAKESGNTSSRLLSLPPEIRLLIYDELLVAKPQDTAHPFYHDRRGKVAGFSSLHPHVLLVCRQINAEATWMLYAKNALSIDLSTPMSNACTREGFYGGELGPVQALLREQCQRRHFTHPGVIDARSFQRLSRIQITASTRAVWGKGPAGLYLTHVGGLLLELLQLLADDDDNDDNEGSECLPYQKKKQLRVTFVRAAGVKTRFPLKTCRFWTGPNTVAGAEGKPLSERIVTLMLEVRRKRTVEIQEMGVTTVSP
ncbi:MAG: hypothetical protein Q9210_003382 [Variospora velana]